MNAVEQFAALRDRLAADLAACIAPELQAMGAVDLAILSESDLNRLCSGLHGCYVHTLRDLYADELKDRPYAATGPAILVCDQSTAKDYARPAAAVAKIIGTAIHETIHAVLSPIPFARIKGKSLRREFKRIVEHEPPAVHFADSDEPEFPIGGHDADFARLTIHLAARMRQRGWEVPADYLWHPSVTGLSYGRAYATTLQNELESAAELPLTEVLRLTPPAEFDALYEMNRRRALNQRTDSMTFLAKLKKKQQDKTESAAERYNRFALIVADGKKNPDEDELLAVLRDLNMTIEQFESRVGFITERRTTKAKADQAAIIRAEMTNANDQMAALQAEHLERQRLFDETAKVYQQRMRQFNADLQECETARQSLRQTAPQALHDRADELDRQIAEVRSHQDNLTMRLNQIARPNVETAESNLERAKRDGGDRYVIADRERLLAAAQAAVDERLKTLAEYDQRHRVLIEERAEIERQMFEVE